MPNTNNFHLYIHLDELGEESAMAGDDSSSRKKESGKNAKNAKAVAKALVIYSNVKSTADKIASGLLSQVELTTGAAEYEQRLQAGYNIGKQIFGAVESIGIGALVGGIPGAIMGLFMSGVSMTINYGFRATKLQKEESLENASITMMNLRAGTAGRRIR